MCDLTTRDIEFSGVWKEMETIRNVINLPIFDFLGEKKGKEPSSVSVLKLLNFILEEHEIRTLCSLCASFAIKHNL